MGNWNITIIGTGAHHNENHEGDANKIFQRFVKDLKQQGHIIDHSSFVYGAKEEERTDLLWKNSASYTDEEMIQMQKDLREKGKIQW